jgi:hypothetical protein
VVTLLTRRRSPEVPLPVQAQAADNPALSGDHRVLTQYLPSVGNLPAAGLPVHPPDVDQERAAALRAALRGHRPDDYRDRAELHCMGGYQLVDAGHTPTPQMPAGADGCSGLLPIPEPRRT